MKYKIIYNTQQNNKMQTTILRIECVCMCACACMQVLYIRKTALKHLTFEVQINHQN